MSSSSTQANDNQKEVDGHVIPTDQDVLQKHVEFFDRNHDGVIYPWETFQGFRAIGSGLFLSTVAAFFINFSLSRKTRPGKFPSLLFPIEVKNIKRAKHGSDSGVYDSEGSFYGTLVARVGLTYMLDKADLAERANRLNRFARVLILGNLRFVPSKFEEIFSKHALTYPSSLTSDELMRMLKANRVPKNYGGWFSSYTEWKVLYILCKDKNGLLPKETIKAVYDGSLFERMEKERSSKKKKA